MRHRSRDLRLLCSAPVLQSPDFERDFVLQTDASDVGVRAVLSQVDDTGADHPVAYFSRKLLPREQKYSTIQKNVLPLSWLLKHSPLANRLSFRLIIGLWSGWTV